MSLRQVVFTVLGAFLALVAVIGLRLGWISATLTETEVIERYASAYLQEAGQGAAIRRNAEERGVENRSWSPEMLELFEATWQDVAAREAAADPFFKKVWEQLQAFRADYRSWGERAFLPRPQPTSAPATSRESP